jgi:hypothetical protein
MSILLDCFLIAEFLIEGREVTELCGDFIVHECDHLHLRSECNRN